MKIYCCDCAKVITARLSAGNKKKARFWSCPTCQNYVGCHKGQIQPLGCIAGSKLRKARIMVHKMLDPLWRGNNKRRVIIYNLLSDHIGRPYHTADIRTLKEAEEICVYIKKGLYSIVNKTEKKSRQKAKQENRKWRRIRKKKKRKQ